MIGGTLRGFLLDGEPKKNLIKRLNSVQPLSRVRAEIGQLRRSAIDRTNSRTRRLHELESDKAAFIAAYSSVFAFLQSPDYRAARRELADLRTRIPENRSAILGVLVSEEAVVPEFVVYGSEPEPFRSLAALLIKLFASKAMPTRNRFRRLVPTERISLISGMVFALSSERGLIDYQRRRWG